MGNETENGHPSSSKGDLEAVQLSPVDCQDAETAMPKPRKSYLPDWVLESRAKLEASQAQHKMVERRLSNLQDQVQDLSLKCEESICTANSPHSSLSSSQEEFFPVSPQPTIQSPEPRSSSQNSPTRSKHLPAWFLESARQLEVSKEQTLLTQRRLSDLSVQVTALGDTIAQAKSSFSPSETNRGVRNTSQPKIVEPRKLPSVQHFNIHILPQRPLVQIALFCAVPDLLKYAVTCEAAGKKLLQDWIWEPMHRLMSLPVLQPNGKMSTGEAYKAVVEYAGQRQIALAFISLMTQTPKDSRNGRGVKEYSAFQRVSSHKDMRQVTRSGLQGLVQTTANQWDVRTATLLQEMGTVKVLMTLINTADSGRVQELACCALANLLCKLKLEHLDAEEKERYNAALTRAYVDLQAFDWKGILIGLLSSPNASLTVCHGSRLNGTYLSSTRCQGMASKHASRVLLNWWSQPHQQILMGMENYSADESKTLLFAPSSSLKDKLNFDGTEVNVTPLAPGYHVGKYYKWMGLYYYSSGSLKDESPLQLIIDEDGEIKGSGSDNLGSFTLSGASDTMGGTETCWLLHKNYTGSAIRVSHIAYWCQGKGMWGVWEMKTGRSEFKLQKGGVFRFIPSTN